MDRNESLILVAGWHRLTAWINSTETADGNIMVYAEVSSAPAFAALQDNVSVQSPIPGASTVGNPDGNAESDDTIDLIGRTMRVTAHAPFSDGASGVGGGGSGGRDNVEFGRPPGPAAKFHPRDELFANFSLEVWNVDDAGAHWAIDGQHWYGVTSD